QSPVVTFQGSTGTPTLTVSATTVSLAGPVQVTFSGGPGQSQEWMALFPTSTTGASVYIDWQWNTGGKGTGGAPLTGGTVGFPTAAGRTIAAGTYVFRWLSATNTVLAQSPVVTFGVTGDTTAPVVTMTAPATGATVSGTAVAVSAT